MIHQMKTNTLQFGWFNHGHHAINKKAIATLPETHWKEWLLKNEQNINNHNDFQDLFHPSQSHTIILDPSTMTFSESKNYGQGVKALTESNWESIQTKYGPEAYKAYLKQAQSSYPQVIPGRQALYQSAHLVRSIVNMMKTVKSDFYDIYLKEKLPHHKRVLIKPMLIERLGELTHILSDMVVPLHTSNPHNWPLGRGSKWGMHHFLEGAFFKKADDYELEKAVYPADNYRPIQTRPELERYLCKYVSRGAEKVFRIVDCQKRTMENLPSSATPKEYEAELTKCVKPLMQEQAHAASKIISRILHSIWVKAGKPDLSVLDTLEQKPVEASAKAGI